MEHPRRLGAAIAAIVVALWCHARAGAGPADGDDGAEAVHPDRRPVARRLDRRARGQGPGRAQSGRPWCWAIFPCAQAGPELESIQDAIKGVIFGDRDPEVRAAATSSLLKLSRTPIWEGRLGGGVTPPAVVLRLTDAQGRPVVGAVVGTAFIRDGDREPSFTPADRTESQVSDEQGEASLILPVSRPEVATIVYAIRPDKDRPLVGMARSLAAETASGVAS